MTGMANQEELQDSSQAVASLLLIALDFYGVPYELVRHRPTHSARAEARAIGIDPADVAKTVVLATPNGYVRAVLPASRLLDLAKVRALLDTDDVLLATEEMLAYAYPEFELGAVPPVGGDRVDSVLIDRRTADRDWTIFEAGVHDHSLRVKSADLVRLADASVAAISQD